MKIIKTVGVVILGVVAYLILAIFYKDAYSTFEEDYDS